MDTEDCVTAYRVYSVEHENKLNGQSDMQNQYGATVFNFT